jgi:hypothetical protein
VDAPTTDVAAFEWPPASAIDPDVRQDAASIVDATLEPTTVDTSAVGRTTMGTTRDASTIVDTVMGGLDAGLTDTQRAMLDFERRWWRQPGAKEQAIRDTFSMSPTRYYQTLNTLLDLPGAATYDAALVNRLQRLRGAAVRGRRLA